MHAFLIGLTAGLLIMAPLIALTLAAGILSRKSAGSGPGTRVVNPPPTARARLEDLFPGMST